MICALPGNSTRCREKNMSNQLPPPSCSLAGLAAHPSATPKQSMNVLNNNPLVKMRVADAGSLAKEK